jgi:hypothetical protein
MQGVDGPFEAPLFNISRVEIGGVLFRDATVRRDEARKGYAPDSGTDGFLAPGYSRHSKSSSTTLIAS